MWQVECQHKSLIEGGPKRGSWELQTGMVAIAQKIVEAVSKNRAGWPQLGKNLCGFFEGKYCLPNLLEIHKDVSMHMKKITLQRLFKNQDCKRQEKIST